MRLLILILLLAACSSGSTSKNSNPSEYELLDSLFKVPGRIIADSLLLTALEIDSSDLEFGEFSTLGQHPFSNTITGFIYRLDCQAGGICSSTHIAIFNSGELTDKTKLAHEFADGSFENELTYEISDSTIRFHLKEIDIKQDEDGNETEELKVDSTFSYSVSLKTGKIHRK